MLLLVVFSSCEQKTLPNEKHIASDSSINQIHTVTNYDSIDKLLFIASGSEPGWIVEFYTHKFRLVVDYGKDSLVLKDQNFEIMKNDEDFLFTEEEKKHNVTVNIKKQKCVEEGSGNKRNNMVCITFKGKTYKGCGTYIN